MKVYGVHGDELLEIGEGCVIGDIDKRIYWPFAPHGSLVKMLSIMMEDR